MLLKFPFHLNMQPTVTFLDCQKMYVTSCLRCQLGVFCTQSRECMRKFNFLILRLAHCFFQKSTQSLSFYKHHHQWEFYFWQGNFRDQCRLIGYQGRHFSYPNTQEPIYSSRFWAALPNTVPMQMQGNLLYVLMTQFCCVSVWYKKVGHFCAACSNELECIAVPCTLNIVKCNNALVVV